MSVRKPLASGEMLHNGKYRIENYLAMGGFGVTYRAFDTYLHRGVAIKEYFPEGCRRQRGQILPGGTWTTELLAHHRQRFVEEGRVLAGCQHPGIVKVYDGFIENDMAYMVMEFIDGQSLKQHLAAHGGRLPVNETIVLTRQIGEALSVVHLMGHLHRDVKPANVLLRSTGQAVLVDFGAAREFWADGSNSQTAIFTPGYAPVEQYSRTGDRGPHTDVYGLAATCYAMMTGQPPTDAISRAAGGVLTPPHMLCEDIPESTSLAIIRALDPSTGTRTQTVKAFLQSLGAAGNTSRGARLSSQQAQDQSTQRPSLPKARTPRSVASPVADETKVVARTPRSKGRVSTPRNARSPIVSRTSGSSRWVSFWDSLRNTTLIGKRRFIGLFVVICLAMVSYEMMPTRVDMRRHPLLYSSGTESTRSKNGSRVAYIAAIQHVRFFVIEDRRGQELVRYNTRIASNTAGLLFSNDIRYGWSHDYSQICLVVSRFTGEYNKPLNWTHTVEWVWIDVADGSIAQKFSLNSSNLDQRQYDELPVWLKPVLYKVSTAYSLNAGLGVGDDHKCLLSPAYR